MDENLEVKTRNTSFDSLAATSTTSDFGIDAIRNQQPYFHWPGEPVLTLSPSVPLLHCKNTPSTRSTTGDKFPQGSETFGHSIPSPVNEPVPYAMNP
jgi:hypothetical protein